MSNSKNACFMVGDAIVIGSEAVLGLSLHITSSDTVAGIAILGEIQDPPSENGPSPTEFVVQGTLAEMMQSGSTVFVLSLSGSTLYTTGEQLGFQALLNSDLSQGTARYAVKAEGKKPVVYRDQKIRRVDCPKA